MKKAATTAVATLQFVQQIRPKRIHLLGMGITNRNAEPLIRALQHMSLGIHTGLDSNRIRAAVGRRRIITRKEHHYGIELSDGWTGALDLRAWGGVYDMTEAIFQAGFCIERLVEPPASAAIAERDPEAFEVISTKPRFLFFRLRPLPPD